MIFHIAVCSPDPVLRGRVQRHCMEYYARRADACIVEQLESTAALLQQEEAGSRYELYLIELPVANPCSGLQAAAELRRRGVRAPQACLAALSLRGPFSEVAKPLRADARFLQPHRSYVVNLAAAAQLSAGELWMRSGARVPIPRGREPAVRAAFRAFLEG